MFFKNKIASFGFSVLVGVYLLLSFGFQRTVPLFEAPDEPSHLQYTAFIVSQGRLPRFGKNADIAVYPHPPLYFLMASPFLYLLETDVTGLLNDLQAINLSANRFDPHAFRRSQRIRLASGRSGPRFGKHPDLSRILLIRTLSLIFGLAAVVFTFLAARLIFYDDGLALLATGFTAFNPQFLFASSYMSNDTMAAAVGAAALWLVADATVGPTRRHYLLGGLLAGLGVLTKYTTLPGLLVAAIAVVIFDRRQWKQRFADAAGGTGIALLLAGPYLIWNIVYLGSPLGTSGADPFIAIYPKPPDLSSYFAGPYWQQTFASYWARFGWSDLAPPGWVTAGFALLSVLGLGGCVLAWRNGRSLGSSPVRFFAFASIGLTLAFHVSYQFKMVIPFGRYFFPVTAQISCVLAAGLAGLYSREGRFPLPGAVALLAAFALLSLYCLFGVIAPTYA